MRNIHNFSAGPGALPKTVLEQVGKDLFSYRGTGVSVMELSHRSAPIVELIDDTTERFRNLLGLDDQWEVILLQGGGSLQFIMVPMNLSMEGEPVDYADTGYWSRRAIREVSRCNRDVKVFSNDTPGSYHKLPGSEDIKTRENARYLHICTNNTVVGTQWHQLPNTDAPLVLDASSDLLSRNISMDNVNCLYAHAQKNAGLAGVTVVAVRKTALIPGQALPYILDYQSHIDQRSNYHTPPVFSIYVTNLMLRWLEYEVGGVETMSQINEEKSQLLYDAIDNSRLFSCPVTPRDRSRMNVVFSTGSNKLDSAFIEYCLGRDLIGVAGHRSQGGMRASLYNAVTLDDVSALVNSLQAFEQENQPANASLRN